MNRGRVFRLFSISLNSYIVHFKKNIFLTISVSISILLFLGVSLYMDFNYATYVKGNSRIQDNYIAVNSCSEDVTNIIENAFLDDDILKCQHGALNGLLEKEDGQTISMAYNVLMFNSFPDDIFTYSGIDYMGNTNDSSNNHNYEKYRMIAGRNTFQNDNEIIVSEEYADLLGKTAKELINTRITMGFEDHSNSYKIVGVFAYLNSEKILNKDIFAASASDIENNNLIVSVILPEGSIRRQEVVGTDYYFFFHNQQEYDAINSFFTDLDLDSTYSDEFIYYTKEKIEEDNNGEWSSDLTIKTILLLIISVFSGISVFGTMYNSVLDRKKEIGIKKALGATDGDIVFCFIIENMINSIVSIVLATSMCSIAFLVYAFYQRQVLLIDYTICLYPVTILLFFCYALAIIIGFSLIPAYRATQLDVVDTLRDE